MGVAVLAALVHPGSPAKEAALVLPAVLPTVRAKLADLTVAAVLAGIVPADNPVIAAVFVLLAL